MFRALQLLFIAKRFEECVFTFQQIIDAQKYNAFERLLNVRQAPIHSSIQFSTPQLRKLFKIAHDAEDLR